MSLQQQIIGGRFCFNVTSVLEVMSKMTKLRMEDGPSLMLTLESWCIPVVVGSSYIKKFA